MKPTYLSMLIALMIPAAGCGTKPAFGPAAPAAALGAPPTVRAVQLEKKALKRQIEQPAQVEAFETTPLFAKIPGYVKTVNCDVGDAVTEGQVLANLSVPEMEKELQQKRALVTQAEAEVEQGQAALQAAQANVATTKAGLEEAEAGRKRADANYERWQSEYKRADSLVKGRVIDEQTRDETRNQFLAAAAARDEVEAKIHSCEACLRESEARRSKAKADLDAARAKVGVAEAEKERMEAMLKYAEIPAPFNGRVTRRNIHTGHFLQPMSNHEPLFVVTRSDLVRVVAEMPEAEAGLIADGVSARVRVQALKDQAFDGKVTRSSWALDPKSRTLRTEVHLSNPKGVLRPGMYAYVTFTVEFPPTWALPASAVTAQGEQTVGFRIENGKVFRTPVKVGRREGGLVEVQQIQVTPGEWTDPSDGNVFVDGGLSGLTDGQTVK